MISSWIQYFYELIPQDTSLLLPGVLWLSVPLFFLIALAVIKRKFSLLTGFSSVLLFLTLILSLSRPLTQNKNTTQELLALVDMSYSISPTGRLNLLQALQAFLENKISTSIRLLPFGRRAGTETLLLNQKEEPEQILKNLKKIATDIDTGDSNLSTAIQAGLNNGKTSSLLLLSDGFETSGKALEAARIAANKGVKIFPLIPDQTVFQQERINISSLYAATTIKAGERTNIRVSLNNSFSSAELAELEVWLDNKKLFSEEIEVPAQQEKLIQVKTPAISGGLHRIRAVLKKANSNSILQEHHRWLAGKESTKILLISGTKQDQKHLRRLLRLKGYALQNVVADGNNEIPVKFENFSSIIINNTSKAQLPKNFLSSLERFVEKGGGLLLVGGDRSFGLGGYIKTPLEKISPLKFVPPQTRKRRLNSAVVLLIDKSGSMRQQNKIEAARQSAYAVINSLKNEDYISIIGFDSNAFVVMEIMRVKEAKRIASRRLRNLTPKGKTFLFPALAEARLALRRVKASRKHILVLSDGKDPHADQSYFEMISRLRADGVTISTISLGDSAGNLLMQAMSNQGKGAFYPVIDPSILPRIFLQDLKVYTGELTLKEKGNYPIAIGPAGLLSTKVKPYPKLRGFVETLPKKGSSLELVTKKDKRLYPILASWKYKEGKVIAFSSDANARWSLPWINWDGFAPFWSQILRSLKAKSGKKSGEIDFDFRYRVDGKAVIFDLALFDSKLRSAEAPPLKAKIIEPGGERRELNFKQVKKGRFIAQVENGRPGDYRLSVKYGELKLPPLAATISGEVFGEQSGRGLDIQTLSDIAFLSGGSINPPVEKVNAYKRVSKEAKDLFPPLLILAFVLLLLTAFVREIGPGALFRLPKMLLRGARSVSL